jgi:hypothetical protein
VGRASLVGAGAEGWCCSTVFLRRQRRSRRKTSRSAKSTVLVVASSAFISPHWRTHATYSVSIAAVPAGSESRTSINFCSVSRTSGPVRWDAFGRPGFFLSLISMGASLAASSPLIDPQSLPEWKSYKDDPTGETLAALNLALAKVGQSSVLASVLHRLFIEDGNWKVAQHLALLLEQSGYAVHAMYFAHRARQLSGGDVFARMLFAKILWIRRLPTAILYETTVLRVQVRRLRDRARRRILQREIAELNVQAFAYLKDAESSRRWLNFLRFGGSIALATAVQVLLGFREPGNEDLFNWAAITLAARYEGYGGRVRAGIQLGVRRGFIRLLGSR